LVSGPQSLISVYATWALTYSAGPFSRQPAVAEIMKSLCRRDLSTAEPAERSVQVAFGVDQEVGATTTGSPSRAPSITSTYPSALSPSTGLQRKDLYAL
jgi:hypothetical protein